MNELHVYCPHCRSTVKVQPELAGQLASCPLCFGQFRVPITEGGATPSSPATPAGFAGFAGNRQNFEKTVGSARVACGLLAIFGGLVGLHKFALGRMGAGLIMLLATSLSCFLLSPVLWIIGIIEGVLYLLCTDEEFYQRYIVEEQSWF